MPRCQPSDMNFSSAIASSDIFRSEREDQAMACGAHSQAIQADMFQSDFDCTSSPLIEPRMERNSFNTNDHKSNELRDFILYRYYLSQYPELFSSQNALPSVALQGNEDEGTSGSLQQSYHHTNSNPEAEIPLFYLSSAEEEKLASKFLELSMNRPKGKLCKRSNTDTADTRCCLLCRCSNRNQSDSSLWSLSEPDLSQMTKDHYGSKSHILPNQSSNLGVHGFDERYSHLSRVITPPNAFLNNTSAPQNEQCANLSSSATKSMANFDDDCLCAHVPKTISYSNKVTQTDSEFDQPKPYKVFSTKLQRFYSLSETQKHLYNQVKSVHSVGGQSVESDHIYHTIMDESLVPSVQKPNKSGWKPKGKKEKNSSLLGRARSLKLEEIKQRQIELIKNGSFRQSPTNKIYDCRTSSLPPILMATGISGKGTSNQCSGTALRMPGLEVPQIEEEHRIATSKNGIPCTCHRCRESRGLNLTTELLPLDAQIPLQSMDNMDSFLQDSMTELVCTII